MWKYAALVSYKGTGFSGWQKQKPQDVVKPSIQCSIETALTRMTQESVSVVGSGRTDAGVHALGQVAHFVLNGKHWDPDIIRRGLNSILREGVQTIRVVEVPLDFHAQRSAEKKQYSYYFQQGSCALPFLDHYTWWIQKKLDVGRMAEALRSLIGEYDFKPFQASGARPGSTIRRIIEAEVIVSKAGFPMEIVADSSYELVQIRLVGNGFLKQMVRGICGTLLQIGEGRRPVSSFRKILDTADRSLVGPTAPGRALWLERVWYPERYGLN